MPPIPKPILGSLANELRKSPNKLKDLVFPEGATSKTVLKTDDLRFDVHLDSQNPGMATGVVQANSRPKALAVKEFLKGTTGGHKGTHQVIGEKVPFKLGDESEVERVAAAIEEIEQK